MKFNLHVNLSRYSAYVLISVQDSEDYLYSLYFTLPLMKYFAFVTVEGSVRMEINWSQQHKFKITYFS